jgi:glycosyltransferase involved in cell wall biosynthesis
MAGPGKRPFPNEMGPFGERPSVSLIVACRNEATHIRTFLESLLAQKIEGFEWQIVVADGMSNDGTREVLREYASRDPRIAIIDNPAKIVSAGLNSAIRRADGEIILRMDAHTEYAPDYVKQCVETLGRNMAENVGGPARTKAEGALACAIQAAYHSRFSTGGARFHDDRYSGYVDTVPYGCWRKSTLLELGLFDEQLVRNQDDELNLRLIRAGGRIWQSADIPGTFVAANLILPLMALCAEFAGAAPLAHRIVLSWLVLLGFYGLSSVVASCLSARRFGWRLLPYLPLTFAVFHLSYGLGFLMGSIYWTFARSGDSRLGELFVGVTR